MPKANIVRSMSVVLSILTGLVFIFSAVAKIVSADEFELYIFSQKILGFHLSTIAARLIIGLEICLGIMMIIGLYFKTVVRLSLALLAIFSLFLIFKLFTASSENCNCFGTVMSLGPLESLIKNLIMIVLLLLSFRREPSGILSNRTFRIIAAIVIITVSLALPFVLSPPDIIYNKIYTPVLREYGEEHIQLSDSTLVYWEGSKVLFFSSPSCYYCRMATKKLSIMAERKGTRDNVLFYFFGDEDYIERFWQESEVEPFPYVILPTAEIITVTDGLFPTLIFVENGRVVKRSGYRDF